MSNPLVAINERVIHRERITKDSGLRLQVGIQFFPSNVMLGWATADWRALKSRTPVAPRGPQLSNHGVGVFRQASEVALSSVGDKVPDFYLGRDSRPIENQPRIVPKSP